MRVPTVPEDRRVIPSLPKAALAAIVTAVRLLVALSAAVMSMPVPGMKLMVALRVGAVPALARIRTGHATGSAWMWFAFAMMPLPPLAVAFAVMAVAFASTPVAPVSMPWKGCSWSWRAYRVLTPG